MSTPDPAAARRVQVLTLRPEATTDDTVRRVALVLAEAFATDPYTTGLLPPDRHVERLTHKFTGAVRGALRPLPPTASRTDGARAGAVDVAVDAADGTLLAAAVWSSPDEPRGLTIPAMLGSAPDLVRVHGRHALAMARVLAACERERLAEPHWHLADVGAVPAARGRGAATALLRHGLRRAAGLPVTLEAAVPELVPFYAGLGFTRTGEIPVPGGRPLTLMRTEA